MGRDKIYFVDSPDDSLWFGSFQEAKDEFVFNHIEVSHTEKVEIEWTDEDTATFVTSVGEHRLWSKKVVG